MIAIHLLEKFIQKCKSDQFLNNEWLYGSDLSVYVRKSNRYIERKRCVALDVANINVPPKQRGKGIFTSFLLSAELINPFEITFIENVLESEFEPFFIRNNYVLVDGSNPHCFYKRTKNV